jgi:LysR family transcriptional regulator, regulator for genes of the gallate degradation pathway
MKRPNLRDLSRYDWIMPGPMAPRQQAMRRILRGLSTAPNVSIETTSLQIYRTILAATDQLTLMSQFEAKLNDPESLAVLPFSSRHLRRFDGITTRIGWQPTKIHLQFVDLLREQASRLSGDMRSQAA